MSSDVQEQIISAIFERRPIWNSKDVNHKNRRIINQLWEEIKNELNIEGLSITVAIIELMILANVSGFCTIKTESSYHRSWRFDTIVTCNRRTNDLMTEILSFGTDNIDRMKLINILNVTETLYDIKTLHQINTRDIILTDSYLTMLPSELLVLEGLYRLEVTGNNMPAINLNMLPYAKQLTTLNVSYNSIMEFETESTTYMSTKQLKNIDLSHNKLDHVPVNCFYSTRDSLQYLDLSHNQISSFDFYAFSSLMLLKTLLLSHNKLVHLGLFLYPIKNLKVLNLDHNQVKELNAEVFAKSSLLADLDLSFNNIELIEDRTFGALTDLVDLKLGNNSISSIKEVLLRNNTLLQSLDLSYNNLSNVEPGTFSSMKNLIDINLEGALAIEIKEYVFTGLKVNRLNFAGSKINKIEDRPFISIGNNLQYLNISSSSIEVISETAFDTLTKLVILDLSNNNISEIAFRTVDLESLSKLYLQNNSILKLEPETFQHLLSLTELDLSNNNINIISPMTFKNLKNLKSFKIPNNQLDSVILSNTFFGLENVQQLELINTKVSRWDSYALSGLSNLRVLNASYGQLADIDYYAFTGTGNIEILDLSHNKIQHFNVKLIPNKNMRKIYLNNNQLGNIIKNAFEGFNVLEVLNLSNNNLVTIDSSALSSIKSLRHLDFSDNPDIQLDSNIFNNLVLNTLLLRNVNKHISFESGNVTIMNLDISSSRLTNVSSLHLHNIKHLAKLDLSQNNITNLDQFSFANVSFLKFLNLSHNSITHINPGTFLAPDYISNLDLSYNQLERIQFGALKGLERLHTLNLTNNTLSSFKLTLLYDIPTVSIIYLDNNRIIKLGSIEKIYSLNKLSVGGNELSCDDLVNLKTHSTVTITAGTLDYFSENVDGIACSFYSMDGVEATPNFVVE